MQNKDQNDFMDDLEIESSGDKTSTQEGEANLSESKLKILVELIKQAKQTIETVEQLVAGSLPEDSAMERIKIGQNSDPKFTASPETEGRIVEGVFDGENMIGPDGKQYSVPANYASKSKLVEGDILKLTITATGTFVYKQINPIERTRLVAKLEQDATGAFTVHADGKQWRVLTASVTYFKGTAGDEAVILVPKAGESNWAAVENVVRNPS